VVSFDYRALRPAWDDFLREVRRVLRPGGSFIVPARPTATSIPGRRASQSIHNRGATSQEFTNFSHSTCRPCGHAATR
jgi:hypothetical protein